jgi:ectoine hydroxylase-related dioxygenase (phytanoyl-CoA dioxygenase family)
MPDQVANRTDDSSRTAAASSSLPLPVLSQEQLAAFRRDGYLLVDDLATPDEIAALRTLYDRLFSERRGWDKGDMFDMVGRDDLTGGLALPQMLWPSRYEPALLQTSLAAGARAIAQQLLGPHIENTLEHAIMKPAFKGAATPWHQDDSFVHKSSRFLESISIWMPLQDVTVENGCMRYIRGSNLGPLFPHRSPNNDPRIHGLELASPPDLTHCVPVPMRAGSAVVHHSRTIHGAGVNGGSEPRRAYVLGYAVKTGKRRLLKRDHPWNLEKQTAREQRELQSLSPIKRTVRRLKRFFHGQKF